VALKTLLKTLPISLNKNLLPTPVTLTKHLRQGQKRAETDIYYSTAIRVETPFVNIITHRASRLPTVQKRMPACGLGRTDSKRTLKPVLSPNSSPRSGSDKKHRHKCNQPQKKESTDQSQHCVKFFRFVFSECKLQLHGDCL